MLSPSASAQASLADELLADQECLGQPFGVWLDRMVQREAPLTAVAQQPLEVAGMPRRGNDQDVTDPR